MSIMKKHRSISFMAWVTVLSVVAIGAAVTAIPPDMAPEQLEKELTEARQQERETKTLADALFIEAHYRARVGVNP